MKDLVQLFFSLTISGSIIALVLFLLKPLTKKKFSKTWHYYIWLVVILRLLLPLAPETSLMNTIFNPVSSTVTTTEELLSETFTFVEEAFVSEQVVEAEVSPMAEEIAPNSAPVYGGATRISAFPFYQIVGILWISVAVILLLSKIRGYYSFTADMKKRGKPVTNHDTYNLYRSICTHMKIKRNIPLYEVEGLSSPMLVGTFRPFIAIPNTLYSKEKLELVLRHELIHYKRRDIFYKWLVQIVLCLHWYNPIVHLVSKEINDQCELSCDELVIRNADQKSRQNYGESLLFSASSHRLNKQAISMGLSSDGKILKERLQTIKTYHKKSILSKAIATLLVALLIIGAISLGGCTQNKANSLFAHITEVDEIPAGQVLADYSNEGFSAGSMKSGDLDIKVEADTNLYFDITANSEGGEFNISLSPKDSHRDIYSISGNGWDLKQAIPVKQGEYVLNIDFKNVKNANVAVRVINPNGTEPDVVPNANDFYKNYISPEMPEMSQKPENETGTYSADETGFTLIDGFSYAGRFTGQAELTLSKETTFKVNTTLEVEKGNLDFRITRKNDDKLYYQIQSNIFDNIDEITLKPGEYILKIESGKTATINADFSIVGTSVPTNSSSDTGVATESKVLAQRKIDGVVYNIITSEEDLSVLADGYYSLSENYLLGNDITLTGEWKSIGTDKVPFTGIFDGNGYIIRGLTASKGGAGGFFARADGAKIRNVKLENSNLQGFFPMVEFANNVEYENNSIE